MIMKIPSIKLGVACLILALTACGSSKEGVKTSTKQIAKAQEAQTTVVTPKPVVKPVIEPVIETEEQRIQRAMEIHERVINIGKEATPHIDKYGIKLDLSNPSKESNLQAIALSKTPVMTPHSATGALSQEANRSLSDEELLAIKTNGGVVQAVAVSSHLDKDKDKAYRDALNKLHTEIATKLDFEVKGGQELGQLDKLDRAIYDNKWDKLQVLAEPRLEKEVYAVAKPVDVKDFVNHIDYMVKLIGINHVGICSDFHGGDGVSGWSTAAESHNVTIELVHRGYTEEQITQLWGGNLLRILNEVQEVASKLQTEKS